MYLIRDKIIDILVTDESDLGTCFNSAIALADELGFSRSEADDIASLAAEMINQLVYQKATSGRFFVCRVTDQDRRQGLEMWSCNNRNSISELLEELEAMHSDDQPDRDQRPLMKLSDECDINPDWWPDFITAPPQEENGSWSRLYSRKWLSREPMLIG